MNLADPYLKTARAKEHLDALAEGLREYHASNPCKFEGQADTINQLYRMRIVLKDPPEKLSLIAGDVFNCLRAALDHLVWSLASNKLSYPLCTQFPILDKRNDKRFASQTRGVPAEAAKIIKSLQPYHGKDKSTVESHLLWQLNKLCNIDKHMRIPVHGSTVDFKLPESIAGKRKIEPDGVMSFPLHLKSQLTLYPYARHTALSHLSSGCRMPRFAEAWRFRSALLKRCLASAWSSYMASLI
jgi:hypothetical protein